ncbi:Thiol-disulfide isomerase and thioredoxins [Roseomonas mucosa]|uniref:thioredoxin family protein n=1 Tax=Roseomonas mucosa TaxID=207340 RepID=UPI00220311EF|nr:thioredoxin family protein [Roseomonas mucosa]QDJ10915.1 Thiol-disulfide isomerase and thioredoxins [Roseomonas mucosa]
MIDTAHPDFFARFPMRPVTHDRLDAVLAEEVPQHLALLFLWGRECPNCDIAKAAMLTRPERFQWPELRWLHDNVYDDPEMATRFGLHGIPVFFLFQGRRVVGRITGWPGAAAFTGAIAQQLAALPSQPR